MNTTLIIGNYFNVVRDIVEIQLQCALTPWKWTIASRKATAAFETTAELRTVMAIHWRRGSNSSALWASGVQGSRLRIELNNEEDVLSRILVVIVSPFSCVIAACICAFYSHIISTPSRMALMACVVAWIALQIQTSLSVDYSGVYFKYSSLV